MLSTTFGQIWEEIKEENNLETSIIASAFIAQEFLSEPINLLEEINTNLNI